MKIELVEFLKIMERNFKKRSAKEEFKERGIDISEKEADLIEGANEILFEMIIEIAEMSKDGYINPKDMLKYIVQKG